MLKLLKYVVGLSGIILLSMACRDKISDEPDSFVFKKEIGGDGLDYAVKILESTDGNYMVLGRTTSYGMGESDVYFLKVSAIGEVIWEDNYGGSDYDEANAIIRTDDAGYLIVGSTLSFGNGGMDMMLIKTDAAGKQQFFKTYGDRYYDKAFCIAQAPDGNYVIGGYRTSILTQDKDMALLKVDADGEEIWSMTYDLDSTDIAKGIMVLDDGYFVYGESIVGDDNSDITLVKTDFEGNAQWIKNYGGDGVEDALDMEETVDGTYMMCGYTGSHDENVNNDMYLLEVDEDGNIIQSHNYGDSGEWDYEEGYSIIKSDAGGFYVSGRKRSSIWIAKIDANMNEVWTTTYGDLYDTYTKIGYDLIEESDGNVLIVGGETNSPDGDINFLKLDPDKVTEE